MEPVIIVLIVLVVLFVGLVIYRASKKSKKESDALSALNGSDKEVKPVLSSAGGDCPCDETAWCNTEDNKCYERCVTKGSCEGAKVPRKDTYFCDYKGC